MASQLPYLPPLERYKNDVRSIATNTAEDVRAAQGTAAKAGLITRGALAAVPATVRAASDILATPARAVVDQAVPFLKNFVGGPQPPVQPPTLGLPQLAKPAAAPAVAEAPATQAPVATSTTAGGLTTARVGNNVTITGQGPAPAPAMQSLPVFLRPDPVAIGIARQRAYAESQRQAVMNAADIAAASGNPGNASYRYAAALHALPALSGSNTFAASEAQLAAERASTAERERSNIRTTGETRFATEERSKEVRRNAQPTVIGEEINPDPTTRIYAPTIKKYGFVERDPDTGKITVRDMQGNEQKPPEAPKVSVGVKVKQKDGSYPIEGGRTAVVKGGVVTEVK